MFNVNPTTGPFVLRRFKYSSKEINCLRKMIWAFRQVWFACFRSYQETFLKTSKENNNSSFFGNLLSFRFDRSCQKTIGYKIPRKKYKIDEKTTETSVQNLLSLNFYVNYFNKMEKRETHVLLLQTQGKGVDSTHVGFCGTLYEYKVV